MPASPLVLIGLALFLASDAAEAEPAMTSQAIEEAAPGGGAAQGRQPLAVKAEILLDRNDMSPGVIDGVFGANLTKAVRAFQTAKGLPVTGELSDETWAALGSDEPVLTRYTIVAADLKGPFLKRLPEDYGELAKLKRLSYTSPLEMFSERFHMEPDLLTALNPGVNFKTAGVSIVVANVRGKDHLPPVARLVADKQAGQLRGYDAEGRLLAAYPATIGSPQLPSPSGRHTVTTIAFNAAYNYRPEVNFRQGNNTRPLTIPPGPNNPVGTVWIGLSKPTYGIHGTPAPSKIDKTFSHGCVRLTNWDAEELAKRLKKGVPVEFE